MYFTVVMECGKELTLCECQITEETVLTLRVGMIWTLHYSCVLVFACTLEHSIVSKYMGKCYLIILYIKEHMIFRFKTRSNLRIETWGTGRVGQCLWFPRSAKYQYSSNWAHFSLAWLTGMARFVRNTFLLVKSYSLPHNIRCQVASNLLTRVICGNVVLTQLHLLVLTYFAVLKIVKWRRENNQYAFSGWHS